MKISIIVAKSLNNVIGKDNQLIWRLSADMQLFKSKTTGHPIIMGRKTYESVGKPLPNRTSIVITRNKNYQLPEGHFVVHSLEEAVQLCIAKKYDQIFIIGGAEIYQQALPLCDELLVTEVNSVLKGDVYFPEIDPKLWESESAVHFQKDDKNDFAFNFVTYKKSSHEH